MINWLDVRNFVLVKHISLNFSKGMTVLTGETGAGKSIIVDALAILLGDRTSGEIVRKGSDRAEIQASFNLRDNLQAVDWLASHSLSEDTGECSLRRLVFKSQSSRGFINGRPVPIHYLQELGNLLVDIHSQHDHHRLLQRKQQRVILDAYANTTILVEKIGQLFARLKDARQELDELQATMEKARGRKEYLRHQVEELTMVDPDRAEFEALEEKHKRLSHARELTEDTWKIIQTLDELEDTSASTLIHKSIQRLLQLAKYDPRLDEVSNQLEIILSQLTEIMSELRRWQSEYDLDPREFDEIQNRFSVLHETSRKYQVPPSQLQALFIRLKEELLSSQAEDSKIDQLSQEIFTLEKQYDEIAEIICKAREISCQNLADSVTQNLIELGFNETVFQVKLVPIESERRSRHGTESVIFLIRSNPNAESGPLAKVASGGELSRISLAIQVATMTADTVPSSIYDEVDVGIGGRIAEIVGSKLKVLGNKKQILCITHLPQVAVQGEEHLAVSKGTEKNTEIYVQALNEDERLEEISRMLGGIEITDETRAHAADMLKRAGN